MDLTEKKCTKVSKLRAGMLLRLVRNNLSITQSQLAEELGLAQSTVSRMEEGKLLPVAPDWLIICSKCNINPFALIDAEIYKVAILKMVKKTYRVYPNTWGKDYTPLRIKKLREQALTSVGINYEKHMQEDRARNNSGTRASKRWKIGTNMPDVPRQTVGAGQTTISIDTVRDQVLVQTLQ